ncbi:MAG: AbrB/MazE/SpoVT family DNA-binding domain-containing protein [Bacillota bacterium]|nr:AbrB/MazE/SpoVT family DNA-binding domain-containing protein [Bacillota bacterium]
MDNLFIDSLGAGSIYFVYTKESQMKKKAKVFALGNSSGIRFTKEMMEALNLQQNDEIEYEILDNQTISIKKAISKKEKSFDDFFKDYKGEYSCEEIDFGSPVGRELL